MKYFKSVINWFRLQFKPEKKQVERTLVDLFLKMGEDDCFNSVWLEDNIKHPTKKFKLLTRKSKAETERLKFNYVEAEKIFNSVLERHNDLNEEMVYEVIKIIKNNLELD